MLLIKAKIAPSTIPDAGVGLFADQDIEEGTIFYRHRTGAEVELSLEQLLALPEVFQEKMYTHGVFDPESGTFVLPADNSQFVNHSDQPNCGLPDGPNPEGVAVALRDITCGEELTIDYRTAEVSIDFAYRPPSFAEAFITRVHRGYWPTSTRP